MARHIWTAPRLAQRQHAFKVGARMSVCGKYRKDLPVTKKDDDASRNPHLWSKAHCVRCSQKLEKQRIRKGRP
jgi:hypothetical protein